MSRLRNLVRPAWALAALLTLDLLGLLWASRDLALTWADYSQAFAPGALSTRTLRLVVLGLGLVLLAALCTEGGRAWRVLRESVSWRPIRLWLLGLCPPLAVSSLAWTHALFEDHFLTASLFLSLELLWSTAWALAVLLWPGAVGRGARGLPPWIERPAAALLALLFLAEAMACGYDYYFYTEAFMDQSRAQRYFAEYRQVLGGEFLGFPFNSMGYYDGEFYSRGERDMTAAFISGSFGLGVTPHSHNFTTVAERALRDRLAQRFERVDVFNFGIPNMGMPEYSFMLQTEILALKPWLTVLCVFVGNDLYMFDQHKLWRSHVQNWALFRLARRLFVTHEPAKPRIDLAGKKLDGALAPTWEHLRTGEEPDYVLDPSKEQPRLPEDVFMAKESERVKLCNASNYNVRQNYRLFFQALGRIREAAGERFSVVVIPDEFQVNDELWGKLMADKADAADFQRDYPQRRILNFCQEQGLDCLDLLPVIREAQQGGRTYHLRDTHWNARGNQAAGEAIASRLLDRYFRDTPGPIQYTGPRPWLPTFAPVGAFCLPTGKMPGQGQEAHGI